MASRLKRKNGQLSWSASATSVFILQENAIGPLTTLRSCLKRFIVIPKLTRFNQQAYSGSWSITKEARESHPEIAGLHKDFFSMYVRPPQMTRRVNELKEYFKEELYKFARRFDLEILIIENAVTIPLNLPLGLAITEFIAETGYPTIAHHHDFYWERQRFQVNCVSDYLATAFPPHLPSIRHVVINSIQAQQIASRHGLTSRVIPNVMDFDSPLPAPDSYTQTVRGGFRY